MLDAHVDPQSIAKQIPDCMDDWLATFVRDSLKETAVLVDNGATGPALARYTLLRKLIGRANEWYDSTLDVSEAACVLGTCEETVRRKIRSGELPDLRSTPRGRHRTRRREVASVARRGQKKYDPVADAQDVAMLRRKAG